MSTEDDIANQAGARNLDALIKRALDRFGMTYATFVGSVTQYAFGSLVVWSETDLERLLLACEALGLSPVGRDMYALRQEGHGSAVLLAVGLDGWARIVNRHPAFDGLEFTESPELLDGVPAWISCTIHRQDRRVPLTVKEYLCECRRDSSAWQTHPRRMLRHKAPVQCARLAFELPTPLYVYDPDEAERVLLSRTGEHVGARDTKLSVAVKAGKGKSTQASPTDSSQSTEAIGLSDNNLGKLKKAGNSRKEELVATLLSRQLRPVSCEAEALNQEA